MRHVYNNWIHWYRKGWIKKMEDQRNPCVISVNCELHIVTCKIHQYFRSPWGKRKRGGSGIIMNFTCHLITPICDLMQASATSHHMHTTHHQHQTVTV